MTKRACPFDTGILRQFKVHVNNWKCDKAVLEDMQKKTIEKLFAAQRTGMPCRLNNKHDERVKSEKSMRQLEMTKYLSCKDNIPLKKIDKIDCLEESDECSYCDSITEDMFRCKVCSRNYCESCSFPDFCRDSSGRICTRCS